MIFDPERDAWDALDLPPGKPLAPESSLTPDALCPPGCGCFLWTDRRLIAAYDRLSRLLGRPAPVRYGFRRPGAFLHRSQSAHCAGLALDLALQSEGERAVLTRLARESRFDRVEPAFLSPAWIHAECVVAPPAWPRAGYPALRPGDRGVHVMVLQDLLSAFGLYHAGLTGIFNETTSRAVFVWRRENGLPPAGKVDSAVWESFLQPRRCTRSQYPPSLDLM